MSFHLPRPIQCWQNSRDTTHNLNGQDAESQNRAAVKRYNMVPHIPHKEIERLAQKTNKTCDTLQCIIVIKLTRSLKMQQFFKYVTCVGKEPDQLTVFLLPFSRI